MRIDIITVVPQLLESPFTHSIMKGHNKKACWNVHIHNLRDCTPYAHAQVDDYQFGGGAGMVMMPEPLIRAIEALQSERTYDELIYMTPDGGRFEQKTANRLSMKENLMIICGHYGYRRAYQGTFHHHGNIRYGDYVLSGGELAAAVVVDAVGRLLPGVLNDETSALVRLFPGRSAGTAGLYPPLPISGAGKYRRNC